MAEGTRFCWRCDDPILPGQEVITGVKVSVSAGGVATVRHKQCPTGQARAS